MNVNVYVVKFVNIVAECSNIKWQAWGGLNRIIEELREHTADIF